MIIETAVWVKVADVKKGKKNLFQIKKSNNNKREHLAGNTDCFSLNILSLSLLYLCFGVKQLITHADGNKIRGKNYVFMLVQKHSASIYNNSESNAAWFEVQSFYRHTLPVSALIRKDSSSVSSPGLNLFVELTAA